MIRGVFYDRLCGVPPEGVGSNNLKNICFTQIFCWVKQSSQAKLLRQMQRMQRGEGEAPKEGWEEGVLSEDEVSESAVEPGTASSKGSLTTVQRNSREYHEKKRDEETYKRFDESKVECLPWELREIIEDYSRIIQRNQIRKLERKEEKFKEQHIKLGGNVYIRNLAGKMTMLEGVEPNMTIWQMKELLDAKTGAPFRHAPTSTRC